MSFKAFHDEVLRLVRMKAPSVAELESKTPISENLDSLACVELIQAAEDHLSIPLSFEEVRTCKTYWDLGDLLEDKKYGGK